MKAGTAARLAVVGCSSFNLGDAVQTEAARKPIPEDSTGNRDLPLDLKWEARPARPIRSLGERWMRTAGEKVGAAPGR